MNSVGETATHLPPLRLTHNVSSSSARPSAGGYRRSSIRTRCELRNAFLAILAILSRLAMDSSNLL